MTSRVYLCVYQSSQVWPGGKGSGKLRVGCWKNLTELGFSPSKKTKVVLTVGVRELFSLYMSGFGWTTRPALLQQQQDCMECVEFIVAGQST